jgi:hypothetical protein
VNHAPASGHPLHAARFQQPFMTGAIPVAHAPSDQVGHRLKAPMGVIREAGQVIVRVVAAKGV